MEATGGEYPATGIVTKMKIREYARNDSIMECLEEETIYISCAKRRRQTIKENNKQSIRKMTALGSNLLNWASDKVPRRFS